jgi:predicted nuclease of predicted toxin-antitoxin system
VRILLDENLNWRLEQFLSGHQVKSVPRIGWAGLKNGKLLAKAQEEFDVLITMDGSMASQQNLAEIRLAIIALRARSNRLQDTSPLMPKVLASLPTLKPGRVLKVAAVTEY